MMAPRIKAEKPKWFWFFSPCLSNSVTSQN